MMILSLSLSLSLVSFSIAASVFPISMQIMLASAEVFFCTRKRRAVDPAIELSQRDGSALLNTV